MSGDKVYIKNRIYKIDENTFEYINSIGEKFKLQLFNYETHSLLKLTEKIFFANMEDPNRLLDKVIHDTDSLQFRLRLDKTGYYAHNIGMTRYFTDIGKHKGSILLLVDLWYKKYGYPKQ